MPIISRNATIQASTTVEDLLARLDARENEADGGAQGIER
jgi:hypothetical protein